MKGLSKSNMRRASTKIGSSIAGVSENSVYTKVMLGNFDDCPSLGTKMIKIFLSSTFSDMAKERNVIMKHVYPKLRLHCRQTYGIEFQFLDMRWGVSSDTQLDHRAPEVCFQEIINCKEISCGINFIVILGHRYGTISLPYSIPGSDFDKILSVLRDDNVDTQVLEDWYVIDYNNDPPKYNLRAIPTPSDKPTVEEIKTARRNWETTEDALTERIIKAVNILVDRGEMTSKDKKRFCSSVTEQEIELGICDENRSRVDGAAAAFIREITDISNFLGNPKIDRYIDIKEVHSDDDYEKEAIRIVDEALHDVMNDVITSSIKGNLTPTNICHLKTNWNDLNQKENESEYLTNFQGQFLEVVKSIIAKNMSETKDATDDLYNEVLQHGIACLTHVKHFQGRGELIEKLKAYIQGEVNVPFIVYGQSGSGKTSILAKAAFLSRSWLDAEFSSDAIILLRFLGTSPGTSNIRQTIRYICRQLFAACGEEDTVSKIDDFKELLQIFYQSLDRLSENRKIFIFLDSIDQLQSVDGAFTLNWLVTSLRPNVKMILSTLPEHEGILNNIRLRIEDESHYLEVQSLDQSTCMNILVSLLREKERAITQLQQEVLAEAFRACSLPIYVNLVYKTVLKWRSYHTDKIKELALKFTVREAIFQFFHNLEKTYNRVYVKHSLAYITASRNGLSEAELEDILSLDDLVLQSVFVFHLPPQIRVPPFLWSRIRQEIGSYLVEREADNCRVLYWYHRQFIEVAHEYLLKDDQFKMYIHSNMADYFLGTYSNDKPKRFYYPQYIVKKENLPPYTDEGRSMPIQPIIFNQSKDSAEHLFNYRRINELPWHLVHSGRLAEFGDQIVFNYDFILAKLKTSSRSSLLADFSLLKGLSVTYENSLALLFNAIRLSTLSLSQDPSNISFDLIGRLSKYNNSSYPRIKDLLEQCHNRSYSDIGFIPNGQCLESGSGLLYLWYDIGMSMAMVLPNNQLMGISLLDKVVTYYDSDGNIVKTTETDVNIFMALKSMLTRRPTLDSPIVTVVLKKHKKVEDEPQEKEEEKEKEVNSNKESGSDKYERMVYKLNIYSGKLTEIRKIDNEPSDDEILDVSDEYIQFDSRKGRAKLFHIRDDRYLYDYSSGVFHTSISLDNASASVMYEFESNFYMDLFDLESGERVTLGLNPRLKGLCCYNMFGKRFIAVFKVDDDVFFFKFNQLGKHIKQCNNVIESKLMVKPKRVKVTSFHHSSIVLFTLQLPKIDYETRSTHGFVYRSQSDTVLPLIIEKDQSKFRKHTGVFGESDQSVITDDEDLLFISGEKCLVMTWSLVDGSLLSVLSLGTAEGFLCGIFSGINKIALCHFPDETSRASDERMYILIKVFNIDELRKPINFSESKECEDLEILEEHLLFEPKVHQHRDLSYDPLDGLILISHSSCKYVVDTFRNITIRSADCKGSFLHLSLMEACNEAGSTVFQVYSADEDSNTTVVAKNENLEHLIALNSLNGVLLERLNPPNYFIKEKMIKFGFSELIPDWIVSVENVDLPANNKRIDVNAFSTKDSSTYSTQVTFDIEVICNPHNNSFLGELGVHKIKLSNISQRPNHQNQLVIFYRSIDRKYDEILKKKENKIVMWPGIIIIVECILKKDESNNKFCGIECNILHSCVSDVGRSLKVFKDGLFGVNYKLEKIDLTNGQVVENVAKLEDNCYILDPLLVDGDCFIVGSKYIGPYKVSFSIGLEETLEEDEDMFAMLPPRTFQMYDTKTGCLVGSYPFENEPETVLLSRNTLCITTITFNETIRCMKVNAVPDYDTVVMTKYNTGRTRNTATKVDSAYGYLRLILTKAMQEVVNKRPRDPISFLAKYLNDSSITISS